MCKCPGNLNDFGNGVCGCRSPYIRGENENFCYLDCPVTEDVQKFGDVFYYPTDTWKYQVDDSRNILPLVTNFIWKILTHAMSEWNRMSESLQNRFCGITHFSIRYMTFPSYSLYAHFWRKVFEKKFWKKNLEKKIWKKLFDNCGEVHSDSVFYPDRVEVKHAMLGIFEHMLSQG